MIIEYREDRRKKDFSKVHEGHLFLADNGMYYIKLLSAITDVEDDESYNALKVENGALVYFDKYDQVTEIPLAKIVLE